MVILHYAKIAVTEQSKIIPNMYELYYHIHKNAVKSGILGNLLYHVLKRTVCVVECIALLELCANCELK